MGERETLDGAPGVEVNEQPSSNETGVAQNVTTTADTDDDDMVSCESDSQSHIVDTSSVASSANELSVVTAMSMAGSSATAVATAPNSTDSITPSESPASAAAASYRVDEDGLGVKGYLSMRDEGLTYHRMKRYFCRCVGVNFYRFSSRETSNVLVHAVFGGEIERVEAWDGRGLLHTYRNSFKLYFTNGTVFNADADSEDDKKTWIEYIQTAIRGAAACMRHWQHAQAQFPDLLKLTPGGLAFVDKKTSGPNPKFKNQANCAHPTCGARFDSTSKRQHHCRNCGGSVCSDHSYRFALLRQHQMNDAVRLCTNCYRVQRFVTWLSMLVQRLSISQVETVTPRVLPQVEQEEVDALVLLLNDGLFGISDVIQVLHLHRHGPNEAYVHAVNKLLELSASNLTDFEFFLPQIFHMWLTMDWIANSMKSAMLFRVVSYAAQVHVRFATSLYWLARAAVDDACGWGFGQSELYIPEYLYRKLSMCKLLMVNLEMQIFRDDWKFQPDDDIPASELQTTMIRCLFDRLRVLLDHREGSVRSSAAYGPICEASSALALPHEYLEGDDFLLHSLSEEVIQENRSVFETQVQFVRELCDMTERLRMIPPEQRKPALKQELARIQLPENAFCPLGSCEDALLRFITIAREEGTVFTTRARAPTLVFFEVEKMSSFSGQNAWLQRAEVSYDFFENGCDGGQGCSENDAYGAPRQASAQSVLEGNDSTGSVRRSKNAIELATSSAIAQAIPPNALDVDGDDRISEAFKAAERQDKKAKSGTYSTVNEGEDLFMVDDYDEYSDDDGDESRVDGDADDDEADGDESRDRIASNPSAMQQPPLSSSRDSLSSRRRSGSLMTMTTKSLDTLMAAYNDSFVGRRKRAASEGHDKEFESKSTSSLRNEVESFTTDQLMSVAQNLEISMLAETPSARGVFSGRDVIEWMTLNEIVSDENHAQWLGEELLRSGVLEHVDRDTERPMDFTASEETKYRLRAESTTISTATTVPQVQRSVSVAPSSPPVASSSTSTPRAKRSSSSPAAPTTSTPTPASTESVFGSPSATPSSLATLSRRKPPNRAASAVPSTSTVSSRIISPRRKQEFDRIDIADAVGAQFTSNGSPRVAGDATSSARSSQNRASSVVGSGNDEQRSVISTSLQTLSTSAFDKLQPEAALCAFESIESALETHVLSTQIVDDAETEALRENLRVLREQLDAVGEYVSDKKKKRTTAVESAFGESFEEKKERLRKSSRHLHRSHPSDWDCVAFIVKSNDDLRQEVLCLQLIRQLQDIFQAAELPLRLLPYRIIATSASTGMIEYIKNATSLDALKKRPGYTTLANHFVRTYGERDGEPYKAAMANYVRSMAAYSLVCYFLQIKDRHNGNIMIDSEGHVVHIDFGFILGIAPGGRFSLETAPFKLTAEMVDAMGGTQSEYFKAYVILLIQGFLALQQHADTVLLMIAIMAQESSCPCFLSQNPRDVLNATKALFKLHFNQSEVIKHVLRLVRRSHNSYRTRQYDVFQKLTNGILP